MDDIIARGPNFCYAKEFIIKEYGESIWNKLLDNLPKDAANVWNDTLLLTNVYSFSAFKEMVKILTDLVDSISDQQISNMYEYIADRSLNTIYQLFFRLTNPAFVIKNYPKLWKRFFTTGTVYVKEAHEDYALILFTLPEIFLDWLPLLAMVIRKRQLRWQVEKISALKKKTNIARMMVCGTFPMNYSGKNNFVIHVL